MTLRDTSKLIKRYYSPKILRYVVACSLNSVQFRGNDTVQSAHCALHWQIRPIFPEKSFNVSSKMCLLLPLFIPLILRQTQTSYPRYGLLFPLSTKTPKTSFQKERDKSLFQEHYFHLILSKTTK